jgi:hypothetical protein
MARRPLHYGYATAGSYTRANIPPPAGGWAPAASAAAARSCRTPADAARPAGFEPTSSTLRKWRDDRCGTALPRSHRSQARLARSMRGSSGRRDPVTPGPSSGRDSRPGAAMAAAAAWIVWRGRPDSNRRPPIGSRHDDLCATASPRGHATSGQVRRPLPLLAHTPRHHPSASPHFRRRRSGTVAAQQQDEAEGVGCGPAHGSSRSPNRSSGR